MYDALEQREQSGLRRRRQAVHCTDATHLEWQGKRYVNFASNDYLGLSHHPAVVKAVADSTKKSGVGSGAAGLISGYTDAHQSCEQAIARWKGTEAAILLPSGYQANLTAVQTIQSAVGSRQPAGVRFLIDKLAHASLIDALRASEASFRVFPHNHMGKLERLLSTADKGQLQVVLTESIFSMDGDSADLEGLASLKQKYNFVLLLDEAHGTGVYGVNGSGYASECGFSQVADVTVITLSKAVGLSGGAVCGSPEFIEALTNFGRAWIYSTMMPPMIAAGIEAAIEVMAREPRRQQHVRELAKRVRDELRQRELDVPEGDSPIVPVILGNEIAAMKAADDLREKGLFVGAVRPPTVPKGRSRLRIALSCEHTNEEVDRLLSALHHACGR
jgi:8-amino-7-oxononanoate synthase